MEPKITVTRSQLVEAFRRWQRDCATNPDGSFAEPPAPPSHAADLLISYVEQVQA